MNVAGLMEMYGRHKDGSRKPHGCLGKVFERVGEVLRRSFKGLGKVFENDLEGFGRLRGGIRWTS